MLEFLAAVLGAALDPANIILMGLAGAFAFSSDVILLVAIAVASIATLIVSPSSAEIWQIFPQRLLGALAAGFAIREVARWLKRTGKADVDVS